MASAIVYINDSGSCFTVMRTVRCSRYVNYYCECAKWVFIVSIF